MANLVPVTVARGDGIGPEIMDATMRILEAAGARIAPEFVDIGEKVYLSGNNNGVTDAAWASIRSTKIFLKAPITTPQGGGYKSVNVTMRKTFGLFSNVRPVRTFKPFVHSKHDAIDMVIVRENEEDLYAGIEYRQTRDTCHSVKFMSRTGSEMIIRYAFEYARANGRKKVTCLIKDNIMKISDGLFHKVFKLIASEYPDIQAESLIVDIGMARIADTPERFDVVVTLNLYGDIVSDIASQIAGSVGLAGSSNIGDEYAMFEAVHGSAPDIAGKGIANPSGLLNAAILMLHHIGQSDVAATIQNAWLRALEDGHHTADICAPNKKALTTAQFADAVIACLGKLPQAMAPAKAGDFKAMKMPKVSETTKSVRTKRLIGVDIFLDKAGANPNELGALIEKTSVPGLTFKVMSSRGVKVYPDAPNARIVTDHWRCRFEGEEGKVTNAQIRDVLAKVEAQGLDWIEIQNLYTFDGERCFSQVQGM
ncbi:MAG: NADP-dependent isocitrate dehydrogenase [Proteobacteria bacterium]|nr:NADP-dependent isocitrate dehydrogenase [Pseudomonadota bacterium]